MQAKSCQRPGQTVNLVDHDHIDQPLAQVRHQSLQGRSLHGAAGKAAVAVGGLYQLPVLMGPTLYKYKLHRPHAEHRASWRPAPAIDPPQRLGPCNARRQGTEVIVA